MNVKTIIVQTQLQLPVSMKNAQDKDYYIDTSGLLVMTESFLKKRGFCCKNNCRHCPYREKPLVDKKLANNQ